MIDVLIDALRDMGHRIGDSFAELFSLLERFSPLFIASSLAVGVALYVLAARRGQAVPESLFAYLFPRAVWRHPSARVDVLYLVVNQALTPLWALLLVVGPAALAGPIHDVLVGRLGLFPPPLPANALSVALVVAVGFAVTDFAMFLSHWLQHRVPLLWEFHKVHHSAEVLTPFTVMRMHPVDTLFTSLLVLVGLGVTNGLATTLIDGAPDGWWLLGGNLGFLVYYAAAYHLRHSHLWLAYPAWLSHWLVSPAQHQIHHSCEERHWDRNMGFALAVWDRLFGTLYVPRGPETFRLGLSDGEHAQYRGVGRLYLLPFVKAWRRLGRWRVPAGAAAAGLALVAAVPALNADDGPLQPGPRPSLQLADLTWMEVRAAIADGFTTVIVPTGGVEQNGPHLVLGKHNYVVGHTSLAIAERLGGTLVAPVVAYVPEGDPATRGGHMAFPGTLSVPEPVFEGILEGAARSLQAAGFRLIVFLGDSGGNQDGQARVAARLSAEWAAEGVRVGHAGDYYLNNGQTAWLVAQSESAGSIGTHAGIRDTSELLAVHPAGVRDALRRPLPAQDAARAGVNGDPSAASAARGLRLLKLKIDAAVTQIAAMRDGSR